MNHKIELSSLSLASIPPTHYLHRQYSVHHNHPYNFPALISEKKTLFFTHAVLSFMAQFPEYLNENNKNKSKKKCQTHATRHVKSFPSLSQMCKRYPLPRTQRNGKRIRDRPSAHIQSTLHSKHVHSKSFYFQPLGRHRELTRSTMLYMYNILNGLQPVQ